MIVDELKKSILEDVLFKNVDNDLSNNSDVLLQKINLKREELIRSGDVKNKKISVINKNEINKNIPSNWNWVRFNNIYNFIDYRGKTPKKLNSGIRLIGSANVKKGFLDFSTEDKYISEEEYNTRKSRGITKYGDILFVTEGGSLGNVCLNTYKGLCSCGQRVICFQQYIDDSLNNKYYMYLFMSNYFKSILKDSSTGSAAVGIKGDKLKEFIVPLPPKDEQQKIVDKIEKIFSKLEEIKPIEEELNKIKKEFPNEIKKSILAVLYKDGLNVKKEKLGTIINFSNIKNSECGEYRYLEVKYLRGNIKPKILKKGKYVKKGTLSILVDGENSGEIFKISEDGYLGSTLKQLNISETIEEKYLIYYLLLKKEYFKSNKRGSAIPHLNKKLFFDSMIYLPTIEEQHLIIDKIEKLLPLCDGIQKLVGD